MDILKADQEKQEAIKQLYQKATNEKNFYNKDNLVFCTDDGKPLDPDNFVRHFEIIIKKG